MIRGPRSGWGGIPPGGDTGQILAKSSDDDGDVEWANGQTEAEIAAGVTPTNYYYEPGDVRRIGTDRDSLQTALNSGAYSEVFIDPSMNISIATVVTVHTNVRKIHGGGTLTQNGEGNNILSVTGNTGLVIDGIRFQGATTSDQTSSSSSNDALRLINSDEVVVRNCLIEDFRFYGVYLENCDRCLVDGNLLRRVAVPIRLRGSSYCSVVNNVVFDSSLTDATFKVGIGLDSTDGHALGICSHTRICGNTINNLQNAQAILVHAGNSILVSDNSINDCAMGVSVNPFNASDNINRLAIVGNVYEGPTSGTFSNANDGIVVQAGGSTPDIVGVVIAGNIIDSANRVMLDSTMGGIRIGYTVNASVVGNVVLSCGYNGIVLTADEEDCLVQANNIADVVAVSNVQRGIQLTGTGLSGIIVDNNISDLVGSSGVGINVANTSGNLRIRNNNFRNVTASISNPDGAVYGAVLNVTSGTTIALDGINEVVFAHSGATTVTTFTGVEVGKLYVFRFANGNTTIDRTNAFLDGGTNKTPNADDVMLMLGCAGDILRQAATASQNS